jgi:hypothetical protein
MRNGDIKEIGAHIDLRRLVGRDELGLPEFLVLQATAKPK